MHIFFFSYKLFVSTFKIDLYEEKCLLLLTNRVIVSISYFTLVLYIAQMGGNPFLNFLFQSAVEGPAFILGGYMGNVISMIANNISLERFERAVGHF